ncbi:hypothetical protein BH10PSE2_BH10PSE2_09880 [soil metagenome]
MTPSSSRPIVFSMGFNGYQWKYARNIASHRKYCEKYGFDYVILEHPGFTNLRRSSAWLKIIVIVALCQLARPWIFYLDTDVEVKDDAPDFRSLEKPGKDFYVSNGFSGRANSGVMIVKNTDAVRDLFSSMFVNATIRVPGDDYVSGWGENGHVIHYSKTHPGTEVISNMWNNNIDPDMHDYLRHYSAGPMRKHYKLTIFDKIVEKACKAYEKANYDGKDDTLENFYSNMDAFAGAVFKSYPKVFPGKFDVKTGGIAR